MHGREREIPGRTLRRRTEGLLIRDADRAKVFRVEKRDIVIDPPRELQEPLSERWRQLDWIQDTLRVYHGLSNGAYDTQVVRLLRQILGRNPGEELLTTGTFRHLVGEGFIKGPNARGQYPPFSIATAIYLAEQEEKSIALSSGEKRIVGEMAVQIAVQRATVESNRI